MTGLVAHQHALTAPTRPCVVCGEAVPRYLSHGADADVVCTAPPCRLILSRRAQVGPHAFRFLVEEHRRQSRERQFVAERSAREALENEAIRKALDGEDRLPAARYPLLVLPAAPQALQPLPAERRRRYAEHLGRIISEAVAGEAEAAAPAATTSPVEHAIPLARQLCTLCRGGCCSMGRDKAYLDAATIRRFMRLRPELTPEGIAAAYLERLAGETVAGSCVNHTVAGCGLPRELRSDTCNTFYCDAMLRWQARSAQGEAPLGAFVIQRGHDPWSQDRTDAVRDVLGVSVVTEEGARSP